MMPLDPFLYDLVAAHQRALREAAERPGGARAAGWWRMPLALSPVVTWRTTLAAASQRLACRRLPACRHLGHGA